MAQTITHNQTATETNARYDVELRKVFKVYNGDTAVRGIDLGIRQGEFFSILGPSGCGKTTTLRLIAGFEQPTSGDVLIRGQGMANVPPYRRPVNTVFQSYALFGHLTVWENVAFGLRIKKHGTAEILRRVEEALQLVKMDSFARRYPSQLSGGQQQRVALARALVNRPTVVLLDEPLGALDLKLRKEMQVELSTLHQELGVTFVMVTHDQEEALSLSNRIAVMNGGRIEQIGTPSQIYENPQTPFVADFIGDTNLLHGFVEAADASLLKITTESGMRILVHPAEGWSGSVGEAVVLSLRPENVHLSPEPLDANVNCYKGRVQNTMYLGTHVHYVVDLEPGDFCRDGKTERITVLQPNRQGSLLELGDTVYLYWSYADCLALTHALTPA
ncbi:MULTISPECIES: ABC transporter ATP-binding protein [unclassified Leptolyngbya]|uniref:ABC transporter ATP-binding protein n=1 Tax=unclassified Leptolyngbya TaxID=2650499 RepID=UPI001685B288|nr:MULTISPECIES: ABC transporter ATP-binding protein [unclassified Leptolyngbya]MBD1912977.1 ABC transporter ATP-binding protein [Leptolyngbya sp. FACHB-8]MBD2155712.1 ABC transporter ATP-binding protein [Leptolyngbya sp. FACHB-16]